MSSGSQILSASGDRVFFPGMELVVQLVDGWFLEIEVGEATQVWEEHLSFLYGYVEPYFCAGLSGLCLCSSSAFSSVSDQSCAAEAVWRCFCLFFG